MIRYTGRAGQFRDAHGTVCYSLRLSKSGRRRSTAGLMRDYRASVGGLHVRR